jgi:ATP-binding cassette, subfamily C (CFTR/MRP), member 1
LTFIVGSISSGKTTLLKGLLGELPTSSGFVYVGSPRTAFVQQNPWIQHKSLRNNILGASVFDKKWYDAVVRACALEGDIAELPQGDLTVVGSAGHSLSGGQRHRLALARAVYSQCRILLLDDTFSGLDPGTEEAVFKRQIFFMNMFT